MRLTRKIGLQQKNLAREHLGYLKPEFVGTRGVWLTAKCYLVQDQNKIGKNKYSSKSVSKQHNDLYFECYEGVLDVFQKTRLDSELEEEDIGKAKNVGFRVYVQDIVTYEQKSLDYLLITISAMC